MVNIIFIILQILKKLLLKVPLSALQGRFEVTFSVKHLYYLNLTTFFTTPLIFFDIIVQSINSIMLVAVARLFSPFLS